MILIPGMRTDISKAILVEHIKWLERAKVGCCEFCVTRAALAATLSDEQYGLVQAYAQDVEAGREEGGVAGLCKRFRGLTTSDLQEVIITQMRPGPSQVKEVGGEEGALKAIAEMERQLNMPRIHIFVADFGPDPAASSTSH